MAELTNAEKGKLSNVYWPATLVETDPNYDKRGKCFDPDGNEIILNPAPIAQPALDLANLTPEQITSLRAIYGTPDSPTGY